MGKKSYDNFVEFVQGEFGVTAIEHPNEGVEGAVIILGTCGGRGFMGGIGNLSNDLQDVFFPLAYQELPNRDSATGEVIGVHPSLGNAFAAMGLLPFQLLKLDSIYFLSSGRERDRMMAEEYGKALLQYRAQESNIHMAGTPKIVAPTGGPLKAL